MGALSPFRVIFSTILEGQKAPLVIARTTSVAISQRIFASKRSERTLASFLDKRTLASSPGPGPPETVFANDFPSRCRNVQKHVGDGEYKGWFSRPLKVERLR